MPSCSTAPTASPTCWSTSWDCVPGDRVLLRDANTPMLAACWFAVLKAGGDRGHHHAAAARPRARLHRRQGEGQIRALRRAIWPPSSTPRASTRRCCEQRCCFRSAQPDGLEARMAGQPARFCQRHPLARRRGAHRLHLGHHRRRQGHDAFPSRRAGDLRLFPRYVLKPGAGRHLHGQPAAGLHLRPRRACCCFRCASAPRPCSCRSATPEGLLQAIQRSPRHHLLHRADDVPRHGRSSRIRSRRLRQCVRPARHLPAPVFEGWRAQDGNRDHRRAGLDRNAAYLHLRAPAPTCGPAPPASAIPGYRAEGRRRDMEGVPPDTRRPARGARAHRLPLSRRCRAAEEIRPAMAGTSPATPTAWTPTAISGTRRAPTT